VTLADGPLGLVPNVCRAPCMMAAAAGWGASCLRCWTGQRANRDLSKGGAQRVQHAPAWVIREQAKSVSSLVDIEKGSGVWGATCT